MEDNVEEVNGPTNVEHESVEQESCRNLSLCNRERRVSETDSDFDNRILQGDGEQSKFNYDENEIDELSGPALLIESDRGLLHDPVASICGAEQDDIVDDLNVDISFGSIGISDDII
jgi:hypothetical protein